MKTVLYFAYGSNLSPRQMRARCPTAIAGARAALPKHRLAFGGYSDAWRGGVATVVRDQKTMTPGLLYTLSIEDLATLDLFEGHPGVYRRAQRVVVDEGGIRRWAFVYILPERHADKTLPSMRYYQTIRRAYEQLDFDRALSSGAGEVLTDALLASLKEVRQ